MRIEKIKSVQFEEGILIAGGVRQSVALLSDADDTAIGGVFRADAFEAREYGIVVIFGDKATLVPWSKVRQASIVLEQPLSKTPSVLDAVERRAETFRVDAARQAAPQKAK